MTKKFNEGVFLFYSLVILAGLILLQVFSIYGGFITGLAPDEDPFEEGPRGGGRPTDFGIGDNFPSGGGGTEETYVPPSGGGGGGGSSQPMNDTNVTDTNITIESNSSEDLESGIKFGFLNESLNRSRAATELFLSGEEEAEKAPEACSGEPICEVIEPCAHVERTPFVLTSDFLAVETTEKSLCGYETCSYVFVKNEKCSSDILRRNISVEKTLSLKVLREQGNVTIITEEVEEAPDAESSSQSDGGSPEAEENLKFEEVEAIFSIIDEETSETLGEISLSPEMERLSVFFGTTSKEGVPASCFNGVKDDDESGVDCSQNGQCRKCEREDSRLRNLGIRIAWTVFVWLMIVLLVYARKFSEENDISR